MKRPKQLPAVDRSTSRKSAAVPVGAQVGPSAWYDHIPWGSIATGLGGLLGGL